MLINSDYLQSSLEYIMFSMYPSFASTSQNLSVVLESLAFTLREDLAYEEAPVQILDWKKKFLRRKIISMVKVLRRNHDVE